MGRPEPSFRQEGLAVMLTYLDTCIFIYWIEGPAPFDTRVKTHLATLQEAGHRFALIDHESSLCDASPLGAAF